MKKLTIVSKNPGEPAVVQQIADDLKVYQELVGGYIEAVSTIPGLAPLVLWCNEDGRSLDLPLHLDVPSITGRSIVGPVFTTAVKGPEMASMTNNEISQALMWLSQHDCSNTSWSVSLPVCPWCRSTRPPVPASEHLDKAIFLYGSGADPKHIALNPLMCQDCHQVGSKQEWAFTI